jgi:VIT1/CCC1 family predicted Fe2+/Mn2+ transporter
MVQNAGWLVLVLPVAGLHLVSIVPDVPPAAAWRPVAILDPLERASEIVFGVLMAMSITGTVSVATTGRHDVLAMTAAALGCNLAWGLTDAAMYLVRTITSRRREIHLLQRIQAGDQVMAHDLLTESLPEQLAAHVDPELLAPLQVRLRQLPLPAATLGWGDVRAAGGVLLLVLAATFPVVLPFLFVADVPLAMRLSNLCAIATLFIAGRTLGTHAGGHPLRYGLGMTALGLVLVAVIVALGG